MKYTLTYEDKTHNLLTITSAGVTAANEYNDAGNIRNTNWKNTLLRNTERRKPNGYENAFSIC